MSILAPALKSGTEIANGTAYASYRAVVECTMSTMYDILEIVVGYWRHILEVRICWIGRLQQIISTVESDSEGLRKMCDTVYQHEAHPERTDMAHLRIPPNTPFDRLNGTYVESIPIEFT